MTAIQTFACGGVFDQRAIDAMSFALNDVCKTMHVRPTAKHARETHRGAYHRTGEPGRTGRRPFA